MPPPRMFLLKNRVDSFLKCKEWPFSTHPVDKMAAAGFYFQSLKGDAQVKCYLCGVSTTVDQWQSSTVDAKAFHFKISPNCPMCRLHEFEAREQTFKPEWWPHAKKKNFKPNASKLAEIGFYFNPTVGSLDDVKCFFCDLELQGWEPEDDPIMEHLKRRENCPTLQDLIIVKDGATKEKAKDHQPPVPQMDEESSSKTDKATKEMEIDESDFVQEENSSKQGARKGKGRAKKPRGAQQQVTASKTTTRKRKKDEESDVENENENEDSEGKTQAIRNSMEVEQQPPMVQASSEASSPLNKRSRHENDLEKTKALNESEEEETVKPMRRNRAARKYMEILVAPSETNTTTGRPTRRGRVVATGFKVVEENKENQGLNDDDETGQEHHEAEPRKAEKRRGRNPKVATEEKRTPSVPKKRGRKPKVPEENEWQEEQIVDDGPTRAEEVLPEVKPASTLESAAIPLGKVIEEALSEMDAPVKLSLEEMPKENENEATLEVEIAHPEQNLDPSTAPAAKERYTTPPSFSENSGEAAYMEEDQLRKGIEKEEADGEPQDDLEAVTDQISKDTITECLANADLTIGYFLSKFRQTWLQKVRTVNKRKIAKVREDTLRRKASWK